MVSIAEFSDEPKFTIKVVCERIGVKPVTLRAWERRYNLLDPNRLENNYRLYSDRDIQVLRWIIHRMENGLSISTAAREYHDLRAKGIWPEALPSLQIPELLGKPKASPKVYSEQLFAALTSHNEPKAREIIDSIQSIFDLETIFFEIFNPCLYEIGEAWYQWRDPNRDRTFRFRFHPWNPDDPPAGLPGEQPRTKIIDWLCTGRVP